MRQRLTRRRFVEAAGATLAAAYAIAPPRAARAAGRRPTRCRGCLRPARSSSTAGASRTSTPPPRLTHSASRASTPRATACGRSTSGAVAGSAGCRRPSAAPTSSRTAPPGCSSTAATSAASSRPTATTREQIADGLRGGRQRLYRPGRTWRGAAAGRVPGAGLPARALGGRGRRAHPQPRARLQPLRPGRPRAGAARVRPQGRAAAQAARAALALRGPRRARPRRHPRRRARRLRAGDRARGVRRAGGQRVAAPARTAGLEQLGDRRAAHVDRPPDPRQRPASHAGRAVAALPRAHRRSRPQRHRRGRARAARHLDRAQRATSRSA